MNIYDFIRKRLVFSTGHILEKMNYDREEFFKHSENYFSDLIHPVDRFAISEHVKKSCMPSLAMRSPLSSGCEEKMKSIAPYC